MRRLLSIGVAIATALAVAVPVLGAAPAQAAVPTTVVLSFDGTLATAATIAQPLLDAHGMHGTFYANSNLVESDGGHLSWSDLTALQSDGHEVGGHALDMVNLTTLPVDQMHAQICQDRATLVGHGLTVNDFAYPSGFGYETPAVHDTVAACGYDSARRAWGLYSPSNPGADPAGAIPPPDPFAIRTPDIVQSTMSLQDLEDIVTRADNFGGGLVPIIFQEICENNCDTYSTTPEILSSFLDFLQTDTNVVVKTMHDALSEGAPQPLDTTAPVSTIACNGAPCSSDWYAGPVQVSLAATDAQSGVAAIYYTTDGADPTSSSTAYTGPFPVSTSTTVKYRAYDVAGNAETIQSKFVKADSVAPATTIACNGVACTNNWSTDTVQVSLSASDTGGSGLDSVHYTTDGSDPTKSSTAYTAPFSVSATTTVKYRAWDTAGNAEAANSQLIDIDNTPPAASIACGGAACTNGWYPGSVHVTLAATDTQSGVVGIYYTTDGTTTPTQASALYAAPLSLSASTTIEFRAYDVAGNPGTVESQFVQVDDFAPATSIECNGAACSSGWSHTPVTVSLAASDTGGSGVKAIHYTTDGSIPTLASPTYSVPFTVSTPETVMYRAWDIALNAEATKSQIVDVDNTAPTSSIACNSKACSAGWYRGSVKVALSGADGGSGVASIHYTLDGSTPTEASPVYTAPLTLRASRNVKTLVIDNAGNKGAVRSTLVRVDATRPAIRITGPKNHASVKGSVLVSAAAADKQSGIAKVMFYVDGKLVATDTRAAYGFIWNTTRFSKKWHTLTAKAIDKAGNVSGIASIRVIVH